MRPNHKAAAAQRSKIAKSAEMARLITDLHSAISRCIEDPRDERPYHDADDLCQAIWQWSTTMQVTPWRYCLDRYCSCKIMLREWEPDPLPGLDLLGAREAEQGLPPRGTRVHRS